MPLQSDGLNTVVVYGDIVLSIKINKQYTHKYDQDS